MTQTRMIVRQFVALALTAFLSLPVIAKDPFARLGESVRMSNYSGVMVYHQGGRMETLRIVHRYENGMEQERLRTLSGDPVEFIRNGAAVTCIMPRDREVMVDKRNFEGLFPALPDEAPEAFSAGLYKAEESAVEELLGRQCRQVLINPADQYRYGYRLWVDQETGVPLKYQLLSQQGEILEQAMFTEIRFPDAISDEELAPTLATEGFVQMSHEPMPEPKSVEGRWEAADLPPGFMLIQRHMKKMTGGMGEVEHIVYGDGIASVSVYVADDAGDIDTFLGATKVGATSAYGEMRGNAHIAVVGEVPQATVEKICRGMRLKTVAAAATSTPSP